jgi:RNA polymerase sigma-70 factor (ECF subfamily)
MGLATTMTTDASRQFAALLEHHRRIMFKVANSYAWHPQDRDDLAQEIAAQLWRAYPKYDPSRSFSTWMYRIALNVAISFVRGDGHRQRHVVPLDEGLHDCADETASHETGQDLRALHRIIGRFGPLDRALLLLYLDDHGHRQIADILGITETNVATKLARLRKRIREDMA